MWHTGPNLAEPSYSELFAEGCFAQRAMVSDTELAKAADQRGIELPYFERRDLLESLDRSEGFRPIGFLLTPFTPETTWLYPDPALMVWREERPFESWGAQGWRHHEGDHINVSERYSPWQLLYLDDAVRLANPPMNARWLQHETGKIAEVIGRHRARAAVQLRGLEEQWRPVIKLLIALQPRLWSFRRGGTTLVHEPGVPGHVDPLERAVKDFDPKPSCAASNSHSMRSRRCISSFASRGFGSLQWLAGTGWPRPRHAG